MDELVRPAAASRLALGTAQWGAPYGINNRSGVPSDGAIRRMLELAGDAGIDTLDTARAYGESEARIGSFAAPSFRIVTKLAPDVWTEGMPEAEVRRRVKASVDASRRALRRDVLDALLLHRAAHRHRPEIWNELLEERAAGRVQALGLSAAAPAEAWQALELSDVELVQVASSLLDQRLLQNGFFAEAERRKLRVHVRSVYLQGVAFMPAHSLPPFLHGLAPVLSAMDATTKRERADLFLAFALELGAERLILGCEAPEQLAENLERLRRAEPIGSAESEWAVLDENLVDPSKWRRPTP